MSTADDELDGLFRVPPGDFVAARDALVAQRKQRGDKAGAAQVKAIKRPTPAAWALNQLHHRHAESLERARRATDEVRSLHAREGVTAQALRAGHEAQRSATQAVADEALRLCEEAGLPGGPVQARKLAASIRGVLAGLGDEALGRLTKDLEASGFDAITVLGAPAVRTPESVPEVAREAQATAERARAIAAAEARVRASERALEKQRMRIDQETRELETRARRIRELTAQLATAHEAEKAQRATLAALEDELAEQERERDAAHAERTALD